MRKIFFLLFLSYATFSQEQACNCVLHGEVLDTETKQPIVGAVIELQGLNKGTITDHKGHYHFKNLCHQKYVVVCKIVGYQAVTKTIDLQHNEDHEHDFSLKEDELHLDHVEIKAQKIEDLAQSKTSLEALQLDQTRGQNLGEALKNINGITTLQTGSSIAKPVIHGMHSNRVLILNNGIRQEGQQWGSEHAPEIDPFVAKKITVLKGASGVRYGSDAIAGVIMLEPQAITEESRLKGEFNSVFFSNGNQAVLSGILERGFKLNDKQHLGLRVQSTYKKGGDISTPTYRLLNTGIEELNFSLAGNYKVKTLNFDAFFSQFNTKIGVFAGSHIGNVSDLISALNRSQPSEVYTPSKFSYQLNRPYQDIQHNLLKIKGLINLKSQNRLTYTFGRQYNFRKEIDVLRGDKNLIQQFLLTTYTNELIFEHRPIFKLFTGSVGLTSNFQENISTGSYEKPTSSTVLIPNFRNLTNGIFLIERLVRNKWEFEAGSRFDYRILEVNRIPRGTQTIQQDSRNNTNFSATIGTNFRASESMKFSFNVATAWRPPTVNELFSDGVHHGAASFEVGNEKLTPEKALNSSFTVNYEKEFIAIETHFFRNAIRDFIFLAPAGTAALTIRGAFPQFFYTQTHAIFKGVDFSSNLKFLKLFSWNNKTSYLQADDKTNNQPLIMIPANRIENNLQVEKNQWQFSVGNLWVFKQHRVPTKLYSTGQPNTEIIFGEFGGDFAPPPSAYSIWNTKLNYLFKLKNASLLNLNLQVQNLFNTEYRDYLNRFRYFTNEIGRNIVCRAKYEF